MNQAVSHQEQRDAREDRSTAFTKLECDQENRAIEKCPSEVLQVRQLQEGK